MSKEDQKAPPWQDQIQENEIISWEIESTTTVSLRWSDELMRELMIVSGVGAASDRARQEIIRGRCRFISLLSRLQMSAKLLQSTAAVAAQVAHSSKLTLF